MELIAGVLAGTAVAATPLLLAGLGELVAEKAGVLNLGVEGLMIVGALAGFAAYRGTESYPFAFVAAMAAGGALALVFAALTQIFRAGQLASGLAITFLGLGLTALLGQPYAGSAAPSFPKIGATGFDVLMPLSLLLVVLTHEFLAHSRRGLQLRAAGENPWAAHAIGLDVTMFRTGAILYGGVLAGLGGAYLSLVETPLWAEGMTAGRGWIALALVVFSGWRPWRLVAGAYLFGGVSILQFHAQGLGWRIPAQYLAMLPYLATIAALMLAAHRTKSQASAPAALGRPFKAASQ